MILDNNGQLLGAKIALDGQWRFAEADSVPRKFTESILCYEDRGFYQHPGISLKAILRALKQNITQGEVVSGASTITMQVMRMSRSPSNRSVWQKLIEIGWATRAELRYTKDEILQEYASNAPFGGNVVGLDAASWRYFNKPAYALTWAESAVLAVLPNAPGMIYPGRNPDELRRKRDGLLAELQRQGIIDQETYTLSLLEDLPGTPHPLPGDASHLLASATIKAHGRVLNTSLNASLQRQCKAIADQSLQELQQNHVNNAAIVVADTRTGEILAYVGNGSKTNQEFGSANDMVTTPRSSGSILKPFLFAAMIQDGAITPRRLIPDIPTQFAGFSPKNYDESYSGAVPAEEALARSLNIPAVRMLKSFGVANFHQTLTRCGMSTLDYDATHYGLSLILGGAEVTLLDLVSAYRNLGNQVNAYPATPVYQQVHYASQFSDTLSTWPFDAGTAWATLEAMSKVTRPDEQASWEVFGGSQKIAWKTGTSYGFRDAWAVGVTPKYTVGIWVGNASGEGRPGISGLNAAAPILFDVFNILPGSSWFSPPANALTTTQTCSLSGMRASDRCAAVQNEQIPKTSLQSGACTYCHWVHLDQSRTFRVSANCYPTENMIRESWFELSPLEAWFYKKRNAFYQSPPNWIPGCQPMENGNAIRMIYPRESSNVFIPRELDGMQEKVVLKAAHVRSDAVIYWHLNDQYLGQTEGFHHMEIQFPSGNYILSLVDDQGEEFSMPLNISSP